MHRQGAENFRHPDRIGYRADIDGLRAVAVMAVLLFHAGVPGFAGGFVGVDVFFVISGFLITGILSRALDAGRFSIREFYDRRIRRIFPALFATVFATGLVAGFLFLPQDFRSFGSSLIATAAFASNILFWRQNGYFDAPVESKPLLHTWSLAIEEQFYILFPVFLMLIWRLRPKVRWGLLAALAFASFALGLWATHSRPDAAFYLLPMRAWELLIGALLALGGSAAAVRLAAFRHLATGAGLLLIAVSVVLLDETTSFPGFAALLPTIGAALVLWSGAEGGGSASPVLASRPFVFVGQISYSLYLWHWPVIVLLRYSLARELDGLETVLAIGLSFLFAVVSWRFIERPFRDRRRISRTAVFRGAGLAMTGCVLGGLVLVASGGLPQRLPERILAYDEGSVDETDARRGCGAWGAGRTDLADICVVGDRAAKQPSFAVIGDSHAEMIIPAFDSAGARTGEKGLVFIQHGCRPALGVKHIVAGEPDRSCTVFVEKALAEIRAVGSIEHVILAARWSRQVLGTGYNQPVTYYADDQSRDVSVAENRLSLMRGMIRLFDALSERRITVIGMIPENEFSPPTALAMASLFNRQSPETSVSTFRLRDAPVTDMFRELARWYSFDVVSPAQRLCDASACMTELAGRSLYRDPHHLNSFGAERIVPLLDQVLADDSEMPPPPPVAGDDTQALIGGDRDDAIDGGNGRDLLKGGKGNDTLRGDKGDDDIFGGPGRDTLWGDAGADRFVYLSTRDSGRTVSTRDVIRDFNPADGDRIDLSLLGMSAKDVALACMKAGAQLVTIDGPSDPRAGLSILVYSRDFLVRGTAFAF